MALHGRPCRLGFAFLVAGALLGPGADAAFAQQPPSEAQILEALKPRNTRSMTPMTAEEQRKAEEDRRFIEELRARQKTRSLTPRDRDTATKIAAAKPNLDIEIQFEFNSDVVTPQGRESLRSLGRALSSDQLKGTVFFINGHTDAKGGDDYNQALSERRAEAVKRALIEEYGLAADTLIAMGHGKTQPKNKADPLAGENRRVQVVNTEEPATASR